MTQRGHKHDTAKALITIAVGLIALAGVCWLLRVPLLTIYYLAAFWLS